MRSQGILTFLQILFYPCGNQAVTDAICPLYLHEGNMLVQMQSHILQFLFLAVPPVGASLLAFYLYNPLFPSIISKK